MVNDGIGRFCFIFAAFVAIFGVKCKQDDQFCVLNMF